MTKEKNTSSESSEERFNLKLSDYYRELEESIVGTIYVDREYRVKSIFSSLTELINISSFEEDLEINDFARQLKYEGVKSDVNHVFKDRNIIKKEVEGKDGNWYLLEFCPHITEDEEGGVVITFVDVTGLKETEQELADKVEKIKELQQQIIKNDVSDRWRLGQYLHDNLAQTLVASEMLLKNMKSKLANEEHEIEKDIDLLVEILSERRKQVRDLSHELVPVDLEEKGIMQAFHNLARELE